MRKRGRSNGSYKRDRTNPADSELKRLQNELNAFIDRQMPGENIKNTKQELDKQRINDAALDNEADSESSQWKEEQSFLKEIWSKIKNLKKEETKTMNDECEEALCDADEMLEYEEETDEIKQVKTEVIRATRTSYLKWQAPNEELC